MADQDSDSFLVGVRVQVEPVQSREIDDLAHPIGRSGSASQMELADAAIATALEFFEHEIVDRWIVEPAPDVRPYPVWPDERYHPQVVGLPLRLGVDQRVSADVRAAGRENAGNAVLAKQRQHVI